MGSPHADVSHKKKEMSARRLPSGVLRSSSCPLIGGFQSSLMVSFFCQFHRLSRQNNMNDGSKKQDHQFGF